MSLIGKTIHMTYDNGVEFDAEYLDGSQMRWDALTGPAKGTSGIESSHIREVAPDVYLVNWLEESGTTVSQVINLATREITAFVTFAMGDRRGSQFQHGTVEVR
jgi:phenolic acid decarboxylase